MEWSISNKKIIKEIKFFQNATFLLMLGSLLMGGLVLFSVVIGDRYDVVGTLCLFWMFLVGVLLYTNHIDTLSTRYFILNQEELKKQKRRLENKNGSTTRNE